MPSSADRPLTAVMTTYNQWALTERCLESLLVQTPATERLIIVENQSKDETRECLRGYPERFRACGIDLVIHESEANLGFAKGMNRGIEVAQNLGSPRYVAILNNDTYLMPGWDAALIDSLERYGVDVVSPFVWEEPFDSETPQRLATLARKNRNRRRKQWSMVLGVFRIESLRTVGVFDPAYFVGYEDADLKHRMDLAGREYLTTGNCVIWHKSKGTRGESSEIERFGLEVFQKKWGFDPRASDHTRMAKLRRSWRKFKYKRGYL